MRVTAGIAIAFTCSSPGRFIVHASPPELNSETPPGIFRAGPAAPPLLFLAVLFGVSRTALAGGVQTLDPVDVTDSAENLVGTADSSNEGTITPQIEDRPILRTGERLEWVPGLLISQHSGEGKANQYYLRGINLDHGTDFATTVDDMPVNMPTHAHGQGYTDLNFVIPELVSDIQYRKGPYYAEEGDFSAVGAAHINYVTELRRAIVLLDIGTDSYQRVFTGTSVNLLGGKLLIAGSSCTTTVRGRNPDNYLKENFMLRFFRPWGKNTLTVDVMGYNGTWNATNQEADRAVSEGLVGYFGTLDPTDRGSSYRYSVSSQFQHTEANNVTRVSAYVIDYAMDLYNDFTYFLENPGYGDQFHQMDRRVITGLKASETLFGKLLGGDTDKTFGVQIRNDNIAPVALFSTNEDGLRPDRGERPRHQTNFAVYAQNPTQWAPKFRSVLGLRWDFFNWNVTANIPQNSGNVTANIGHPKGSLIFGPWAKTEFFINGGRDSTATTFGARPSTSIPSTTPLNRRSRRSSGRSAQRSERARPSFRTYRPS